MLKKRLNAISAPFLIFACLYTVSSFYLFYKQCTYINAGPYLSDMPAYLEEAQGINTTYPFPYHLFFWTIAIIHHFLPIEIAGALATTIFNTLNLVITYYYVAQYIDRYTNIPWKRSVAEMVTASSLLVSMQILPIDSLYIAPGQYFIGQGSGNIWHNATYIATRPFATATFFLFADLLASYENKTDVRKCVLLSLSLFLSTFTKPSFSFAFLAAAAVILLVRLIKNKFSTFKQTVYLSLAVIPTLVDLLRQYASAFFSKQQGMGGIGFGFFGMQSIMSAYTVNWVFSLIMTCAFPFIVLALCFRYLKEDSVFLLAWVIGLCAKAESMLMYETGFRMLDGNFNWGNQHAIYYLMIASLLVVIRFLLKKNNRPVSFLLGFVYMWHLFSGIWYYIHILTGKKFY